MTSTTSAPAFALSAQQQRTINNPGLALLVADVSSPISDDVLAERIAQVVGREEILRSAFALGIRSSGSLTPLASWPSPCVIATRVGSDEEVAETAERIAREQVLVPEEGRCLALVSVRGPQRHCLAVVASTLVADGPSLGLILDDLLHGPRPESSVRYAGYAGWQARQLADEPDPAWHQTLGASAELLDVRLPLAEPCGGSAERRRVRVEVTGERGAVTPERVRAAWVAFLSAVTGSGRILLGHTIAGRNVEGLSTAVGPYARMLPLVLTTGTGDGLDEAAARFDCGDLLVEMADRFDWPRGAERRGFRPFVFGFTAQAIPQVDGASVVVVEAWPEPFAVAVSASAEPDGVVVDLVHDRGCVSDGYADALAAQFGAFLSAALAVPALPVSGLAVGSGREAGVLTGPAADPCAPVIERIRRHAETAPTREAVRDALGTLTYGDLLAQAEALADLLRAGGAGPGTGVVTVVGRDRRYPAAALAALIVGAVFIPVDPRHAVVRAREALATGLADVVVTSAETADQLPPGLPMVVADVDGTARWAADRPTTIQQPGSLPSDAAYVMFTSGSAGAAKPVAVSTTNLAAYSSALTTALALTCDDRVMHTAPLGFSSSIRQTVLVLAAGGQVVIASGTDLADAGALLRRAVEAQATVVDLVPSLWRRVADAATAHAGMSEALRARLRLLLSASEPLSASTGTAITGLAGPGSRVFNMYGQTETTGIVALAPVTPSGSGVVPLGTPVPGVTVAVLDGDDQPVPVGIRGTIHVIGPTVALGYPGREDETAARFRTITLAGRDVLAYDTGDAGTVDLDGQLHFCGRRDGQVQIRGFRVELAEVDAGLATHPAVQEAAAVAVARGEDTELVAFVVPRRDQRPTQVDLVSFLSERIPAYLIPTRFLTVTALPLLGTGKIDRSALTEAAMSGGPARLGYVAPSTPTERELALIWSEVLELEVVGATDNFFELGGHSLRGIDMLTRVLRRFGVAVPWTEVFQLPTVAGLAARIDELASDPASATASSS